MSNLYIFLFKSLFQLNSKSFFYRMRKNAVALVYYQNDKHFTRF